MDYRLVKLKPHSRSPVLLKLFITQRDGQTDGQTRRYYYRAWQG